MTVNDKITFFYDNVKIRGNEVASKFKVPLAFAIPAAAISLAVGAAVIIPSVIKKSVRKSLKGPSGNTI